MGSLKKGPEELIKGIIKYKEKILEERAKKNTKNERLRILGLSKRILNKGPVLNINMIHEVNKIMKEYHPATIEEGLIYWAKQGELIYEDNKYSLPKTSLKIRSRYYKI